MSDTADAPLLVPIPYLPPVSWFVTLSSHSSVNWNTAERYDKKHPRNRCRIATAQGAQTLTVPLSLGRNQRLSLNAVRPLYNGNWQREHVHAIKTAYGRAPFFQYYADDLFDVLMREHDSLAGLNLALIRVLLRQLRLAVSEASDAVSTKPFLQQPANVTYRQVFADRTGFIEGCSGIDLLFNHGPDASGLLSSAPKQ